MFGRRVILSRHYDKDVISEGERFCSLTCSEKNALEGNLPHLNYIYYWSHWY